MKAITNIIDRLIITGQPFALWSEPESSSLEALISSADGVRFIEDETELEEQSGFVFAPFQKNDSCPYVLLQGEHLKGEQAITALDVDSLEPIGVHQSARHKPFVIGSQQYIDDINHAVDSIKEGELSKVIVSRIIARERQGESIAAIFCRLFKSSSKAFVYLVSIPKVGIWMGASPETMMDVENHKVSTVSLAGTQAKRADGDYSWKTKEIEEQAFVSRYILESFNELGITKYETKGPTTLEAANVAHLKTSFSFDEALIENRLSSFVKRLHPTPAVCGLPKQEALKYIDAHEKHQRRYYSGYLGPWRIENKVKLFVNLRCMELTPDKFLLYSGGGITAQSVAEDEWQETKNKSQLLQSVIGSTED